MNKLSTQKRSFLVRALVEGSSVRATARLADVSKVTVLKLISDFGYAAYLFHDRNVRNVRVRRLQCDEIWQFIGAKKRNVTPEQEQQGWGDSWTWTAIDADTKLCVSYLVGGRDAGWAKEFMEDCASRIRGRVQITTDGHKAYLEAVEGAFGLDCDYAVLQKIYGAPSDEETRRYSPARCIGADLKVVSGNPDPKHVSTSYVERSNLTMRMSMRRFTRLTNAFSKRVENHVNALSLYFVSYNFLRIHKTLRTTPAMAAGLSKTVMDWTDILGMMDAEEITPKRGPYKKRKAEISN